MARKNKKKSPAWHRIYGESPPPSSVVPMSPEEAARYHAAPQEETDAIFAQADAEMEGDGEPEERPDEAADE